MFLMGMCHVNCASPFNVPEMFWSISRCPHPQWEDVAEHPLFHSSTTSWTLRSNSTLSRKLHTNAMPFHKPHLTYLTCSLSRYLYPGNPKRFLLSFGAGSWLNADIRTLGLTSANQGKSGIPLYPGYQRYNLASAIQSQKLYDNPLLSRFSPFHSFSSKFEAPKHSFKSWHGVILSYLIFSYLIFSHFKVTPSRRGK